MARAYAKRLSASLAIVDKRRPRPDAVEMMNVIGEVEGRNVVIFGRRREHGIDPRRGRGSGEARGAKDVYAGCTMHPVRRRGGAHSALALRELIVTDSIPHDPLKLAPTIKVHSVAGLLGRRSAASMTRNR